MARTPLVEQQVTTGALILNVENVGLTSDRFLQLCSDNRDLRFELTARKELVIMPLPGADTSRRNVIITTELTNWARKDGAGITFDPACWFILPNGANRGPDAAWLKRERWDALPAEAKEKGASLCPEFVVELMSPSDRLAEQKEKMEEYRPALCAVRQCESCVGIETDASAILVCPIRQPLIDFRTAFSRLCGFMTSRNSMASISSRWNTSMVRISLR